MPPIRSSSKESPEKPPGARPRKPSRGAGAWASGRKEVKTGDVVWSFEFTIPGRTLVINPDDREKMASLNIRARKMLEDFTLWYNNNQVRRILSENNVSDALRESRPLAFMLRRYIPAKTRVKEYRLRGFEPARLLKYFVKERKLTSEQAAVLLQQLEAGYSVRVNSVMVVKNGAKYEAVVPAAEANLAWNLKAYLQK